MYPTSVVILDNDIAFAGKQLQCINSFEGFTCTKLFTDLQELIHAKLNPSIVFLDPALTNRNGTSSIPVLLKKFPNTSLVVNSNEEDVISIIQSISFGVVGYVDKHSFFDVIENLLKDLKNEGAYISPRVSRKIFDHLQRSTMTTNTLTQRELQVAHLIKEGRSYKEAAESCGISLDTVRMHIRNIYKKLDVNSKVQLANRITKNYVLPTNHYTGLTA